MPSNMSDRIADLQRSMRTSTILVTISVVAVFATGLIARGREIEMRGEHAVTTLAPGRIRISSPHGNAEVSASRASGSVSLDGRHGSLTFAPWPLDDGISFGVATIAGHTEIGRVLGSTAMTFGSVGVGYGLIDLQWRASDGVSQVYVGATMLRSSTSLFESGAR